MVSLRAWPLILALFLLGNPTSAQTARPSPAASASPAATAVWHNPPNTNYSIVDPCGGPKELLNKFGPTPCVYVAGEAVVSAGFANINTHGGLEFRGNGPLGLNRNLPISGTANVYPSLFMAFGVSPNAQLQFTLPSEVQVNTQRLGSFSAVSDPSFNYKQRVFFSPTKYTQLAIDLGYTAPTEGAGINTPGPAYQIQLDLAQPLNLNLSFGAWWTFKNAVSTSLTQGNQRAWSDPLGIYFAWSPANSSFEILPVIYHDFNPNRTVLVGQVVQLLGRHLSVAISYGGVETSMQSNGPFAQAFNFAINSSPRVLSGNIYYLINESNLPAQPSAPSPTASP
ncbi:MAG: hypothetical protein ACXWNJ_05055 [Vulcanimicrobiaceae bacterium]